MEGIKNTIKWVVQTNLTHDDSLQELKKACHKFEGIEVIPFDPVLPKFTPSENNIYYGSTTLMYNIYSEYDKPLGLFFNENFSMKNYTQKYGELMLNSDALFTTLRKFTKHDLTSLNADEVYFIRPNADDKSFAGQIMTLKQIYEWAGNLPVTEKICVTLDTPILIADPYKIKKEWRNYIVGGKVVTSSRYQMDGRLSLSSEDIPEDMIQFVEACLTAYKPHDNFAMDIALCGDAYYIIECGCLNSVGLYKCDIPALVEAVEDWMVSKNHEKLTNLVKSKTLTTEEVNKKWDELYYIGINSLPSNVETTFWELHYAVADNYPDCFKPVTKNKN